MNKIISMEKMFEIPVGMSAMECFHAKMLESLFGSFDPTVPAWAKVSTKPSYTAAEVGALQLGDYYAD